MKLNKDKVLSRSDNQFLHHFFLTGLMKALEEKEFATFLKEAGWDEKEQVDVTLTIEGVEIPVDEVCKQWDEQVDRMVKEEALKLYDEHVNNTMNDVAYEISNEMRRIAKEKMGIVIEDDEDWR